MIAVDLALAGLILLGGLWGMLRGAVRQIVDATIWLLSLVIPAAFAGPVAHELVTPLHVVYPVAYLYCVFGLALLTQVVARLFFGHARKVWTARRAPPPKPPPRYGAPPAPPKKPPQSPADGVAGALLGAGKVGLLVWCLLSFAALVDEPLKRQGVHLGVERSSFFQLAAENNLLQLVFGPAVQRLHRALEKQRHPKEAGKPGDPLTALLKDNRFVAIAQDPTLQKALQDGDVRALGQSQALLSLVTDERMMQEVEDALEDKPVAPR